MAVSESMRRQGVARELVRLMEQIARHEWGFDQVYLHVDPLNTGAFALYEGLGFEVQSEFDGRGPSLIEAVVGMPQMRFMRKRI